VEDGVRNIPAGQSPLQAGVVSPRSLPKVPAGQSAHASSTLALPLRTPNLPDGHEVHAAGDVSPAEAPKRPRGHFSHELRGSKSGVSMLKRS
jgi:hypothetical protein